MSIKSSVREAISAIDDNRPADAKNALGNVSGELSSIASNARSAQGDNDQVKQESTDAQTDMARDIQEAQSKFTTAMSEATRLFDETLAQAQSDFANARTAAEETLAVDISAAQTTLGGHVSTIQSRASKISSSLSRIEDLAS